MAIITDTILAGIPTAPAGGTRQLLITLDRTVGKENINFECRYTYADGTVLSVKDSIPTRGNSNTVPKNLILDWTSPYITKVGNTITSLTT